MKTTFEVYSKIGCPYCTKIISALELAEVYFIELKLGRDFQTNEFYSKFGSGSTFPQVTVDNVKLGGCAETVRYLRENNLV
tara:strand:+ start:380 stop:622 length:243 start_codon:yes stop_codon:yes gene_type:complete